MFDSYLIFLGYVRTQRVVSPARTELTRTSIQLAVSAWRVSLNARLRDSVEVDYQLEGEENQLKIAPFLLFPFIENAFKYGVDPEEDSPIVGVSRITGTKVSSAYLKKDLN